MTISVHNLLLSPIPGQHRHHFSSCQVSVELGGEDADATSGQSLGEVQLKPVCPAQSLFPPLHPLAVCSGPTVPVLALTQGFRESLDPWGGIDVSSLQRGRCSVRCQIQRMFCHALSQQEPLSWMLLASMYSLAAAKIIPLE